jgi:hypothetical protein
MAGESLSGSSSVSKKLMWMMIALFAGMAVLLGGGLFMAGRVVRSMGLAATTPKDTVKTPVGTFRLQKVDQEGPGLPVYPRSSLELPGEDAAAQAIKDNENGLSSAFYHTADTRDSVDSWYSKHLSGQFTRHEAGEKPMPEIIRNARLADSDVIFIAEHGAQVRLVGLSVDPTGTKISLIHFDKPAEPAATEAPAH